MGTAERRRFVYLIHGRRMDVKGLFRREFRMARDDIGASRRKGAQAIRRNRVFSKNSVSLRDALHGQNSFEI